MITELALPALPTENLQSLRTGHRPVRRSAAPRTAQPEVVRELQSRRKPHPRGVGIEFPRMHRQHRRAGPRGSPPRSSEGRGAASSSAAPIPTPSASPARTDRPRAAVLLLSVRRRCRLNEDSADTSTSPTIRSGAMLASSVNPSSASTSSAHSERSLIDHSGARNMRHRRAAGVRERAMLAAQVGAKPLRGRARRLAGADSRATRSRGRRARTASTSRGCRSATQPTTKKVARTLRAVEQVEQQPRRQLDARRQPIPVVGRERARRRRRCETTLRDRP